MPNNYKEIQKIKNSELVKNGFFNGDKGIANYPYILNYFENNFYTHIFCQVMDYFKNNNINWQNSVSTINEPSTNTLESQIACLNHLFYFRRSRFLTLYVLNYITNKNFTDVLILENDGYDPAYISFEASSDIDHLNERTTARRKFNTSINALILAEDKDAKRHLVMLEWKYTEENIDNDFSDDGSSGEERLRRYSELINNSKQLKLKYYDYKSSIYFQDEFYKLTRQTLWAEQMIENKDKESIKADDFLHIVVCPNANKDMLSKECVVSNMNLENTWRNVLNDNSKFMVIDNKKIPEALDYLIDLIRCGLIDVVLVDINSNVTIYDLVKQSNKNGMSSNNSEYGKHNERENREDRIFIAEEYDIVDLSTYLNTRY